MVNTRYYTYLWRNESWFRKAELAREGFGNLEYAASNRFRAAGVAPGCVVFIVTVIKGSLFLGGTIEVAEVLDRAAAARYLGLRPQDLRGAKEYIVARPGREDRFRGDLKVDDRIAHGLKFKARHGGFVHPRLDREGKIDRQTLRNARPLFPGAELPLLDLLVDADAHPQRIG